MGCILPRGPVMWYWPGLGWENEICKFWCNWLIKEKSINFFKDHWGNLGGEIYIFV